jgi:hypothetical protein
MINMKKVTGSVLAILFISLSGFAQVKEKRDLDNFSSVSAGVSGEIFITQGSQYSVTLEGDQDLLDEITTKVLNGKLLIRKPDWRKARNKKLTVYITMPEVEGLSMSGSGHLKNKGILNCDNLNISVSGSGSIRLKDLTADEVDISISGSGSVLAEGPGADITDIGISGSGSVTAENFKLSEADVTISGSGRCKIWVEDALVARISGSGSLYYKGDPNIDAKSSGSGRVKSF